MQNIWETNLCQRRRQRTDLCPGHSKSAGLEAGYNSSRGLNWLTDLSLLRSRALSFLQHKAIYSLVACGSHWVLLGRIFPLLVLIGVCGCSRNLHPLGVPGIKSRTQYITRQAPKHWATATTEANVPYQYSCPPIVSVSEGPTETEAQTQLCCLDRAFESLCKLWQESTLMK